MTSADWVRSQLDEVRGADRWRTTRSFDAAGPEGLVHGRQVVSFEFSSEGLNTWTNAENTFPNNEQRAQNLCKELLGDRYGRVLSRRAQPAGDRWYFRHLVCETRP